MKLIGIIGKSGSGKTTLSRMLQKDESIAIIHIDQINNMKNIKRKMPSLLVNKQSQVNEIGEEFILLQENTRKNIERLKKNKLFSKIYERTLYLIRKRILNKSISQNVKQSNRTIIIERKFISSISCI